MWRKQKPQLALGSSGKGWSLLDPNRVMETTL